MSIDGFLPNTPPDMGAKMEVILFLILGTAIANKRLTPHSFSTLKCYANNPTPFLFSKFTSLFFKEEKNLDNFKGLTKNAIPQPTSIDKKEKEKRK